MSAELEIAAVALAAIAAIAAVVGVVQNRRAAEAARRPELRMQISGDETGTHLTVINSGQGVATGTRFVLSMGDKFAAGLVGSGVLTAGEKVATRISLTPDPSLRPQCVVFCWADDHTTRAWSASREHEPLVRPATTEPVERSDYDELFGHFFPDESLQGKLQVDASTIRG